jgi:hypothetical protein
MFNNSKTHKILKILKTHFLFTVGKFSRIIVFGLLVCIDCFMNENALGMGWTDGWLDGIVLVGN